MKSAYELAMERLNESSGPARKLNDEQKARIAEIEKKYDAKAAEIKLGFQEKLAAAQFQEREALQSQMGAELQSNEERRQRDKDAVWNEA